MAHRFELTVELRDLRALIRLADDPDNEPFLSCALLSSCDAGYLEAVRHLVLKRRVDINQVSDLRGQTTPLICAVKRERVDIVEFLIGALSPSVALPDPLCE